MDEQNEHSTANEQGQSRARLRPRQAVTGSIESEPVLKYGKTGIPRLYVRIGIDHYRPDGEDSWVKTGTTFHDMVIYRKTAERAKELFAVDDRFIAQGYVREYVDKQGNEREEFIAKKIGHDPMRTPYTVDRDAQQQEPMQRQAPGLDRSQAFEHERPTQQREPAVMSQ